MRHLQNFQPANQDAQDVRTSGTANVEARHRPALVEAEGEFVRTPGLIPRQLGESARLSESATPGDLAKLKRMRGERRKRGRHFGDEIFSDPAWDIFINLAIAEIEQRRVTISELCLAAVAPATTALRWITNLTKDGVLARNPDVFDRRRVYIEFTTSASINMRSYLSDIHFQ